MSKKLYDNKIEINIAAAALYYEEAELLYKKQGKTNEVLDCYNQAVDIARKLNCNFLPVYLAARAKFYTEIKDYKNATLDILEITTISQDIKTSSDIFVSEVIEDITKLTNIHDAITSLIESRKIPKNLAGILYNVTEVTRNNCFKIGEHSQKFKLYDTKLSNFESDISNARAQIAEVRESIRDIVTNLEENSLAERVKTLEKLAIKLTDYVDTLTKKAKDSQIKIEEIDKNLSIEQRQQFEEIRQKLENDSMIEEADKKALLKKINTLEEKLQGLANQKDLEIAIAEVVDMLSKAEFTQDKVMDLEEQIEALSDKLNKIKSNKENSADTNITKTLMIYDIVYDNKLLNNPELLNLAVKKLGWNKAVGLSEYLSEGLIQEALINQDQELILAGIESLMNGV